jgi:hypothetical protein
MVYGSVEPLLAEDATANKGKLKLSISDSRNPNIVSKTVVRQTWPHLSTSLVKKSRARREVRSGYSQTPRNP